MQRPSEVHGRIIWKRASMYYCAKRKYIRILYICTRGSYFFLFFRTAVRGEKQCG